MTTKFKHDGGQTRFTVTGSNVVGGQLLKVGDMVGIVVGDEVVGQTGVLARTGTHEVDILTAEVVAHGQRLYYVDGANRVTVTAGGNFFAGFADMAKGAGPTVIDLTLAAGASDE